MRADATAREHDERRRQEADERARTQQRLAEIRMQLQQTSQSVRQGKQLRGSLADNYGNATVPEPTMKAGSPERPPASTPGVGAGGDLPSPTRILGDTCPSIRVLLR